MRTELREALSAAREHDEPYGQIRIIKQAVMREVRALDPTVSLRFTEYFNHSVAPDIVLSWPNEARERFLFVRSTGSSEWLLNEMRFLSPHQPLVFTLEDLDPEPQKVGRTTARQALESVATEAGTWITDPSGTEAMAGIRNQAQSPPLEVLSQALVRGGRGVSDENEIRKLSAETEDGFTGASQLVAAPISSAIDAIEHSLSIEQAGRLTRLLRAIWDAGGGAASAFPQTSSLGKLNEDDLSYILKTTGAGPRDFWRAIGRAISTEMLGRLHIDDYSSNLQALVSENLELFQAKGIRLIDEPLWLGEPEQNPRWIVNRGCLGLRGENWTAYIAARRVDEFPPEIEVDAPDLATLRNRASIYQVPISKVQLGRDDRAVTYESVDGRDVLADPELSNAEENFGVRNIEGAEATLPDGGTVEIEFRKGTAAGHTSAVFPLGSLIRSTLFLMNDFPSDELLKINETLEERDALFQRFNPPVES